MKNEGIITKGISGIYTVFDGENFLECSARGIFRKNNMKPLPGDRIVFSEGVIEEIKPRKNCFIRPAVANLDQIAFFMSVKSPEPDMFLLDKMFFTALEYNVNFIICINKCDYDGDGFADTVKKIYEPLGTDVVLMQAVNGVGVSCIADKFQGKITALAGQSGVGKSTTVNGIFQKNIMITGNISEKSERGKHTTRHAELIKYGSGFIIDTPGFSAHELPEYDIRQLRDFYPEFLKYRGDCKFKECIHINEPGCAVKEQVEKGNIDLGRYERYIKFVEEINIRKANKYK